MTLTELRYIVAVARERHFGRAAAACFVSQPTLSVAIKKLEDELGVAVFERGKSDVRVTPVGERIVAQARLVLEEIEGVKRIAKQEQDQLDGPLRLGAIYTVAPYLLPQLIPTLHKQAPNMPLVIEENYTARLQERLLQGELDVIIISLPFAEPGVTVHALYDEPFMVVLPASHPWRERTAITVKELSEEPVLMLGEGHCFREQLLNVCPDCRHAMAADDPLGKAVEGGSLETIRHMVASGLGITVMPCTATGADRYAQRLLVLKRFKSPVPKRRVALAWRNSFYRPQAVTALAKAIRACKLSCVEAVGK